VILVTEKQKRRLKKVSVGEGIDLFITYVCREKGKKEKKSVRQRKEKLKKKNGLTSPFPMI
jgi:hypothetical protein